jgi:low affinity Fe/Cu permease
MKIIKRMIPYLVILLIIIITKVFHVKDLYVVLILVGLLLLCVILFFVLNALQNRDFKKIIKQINSYEKNDKSTH